jgi:histidinol phosphatase-like PHP family hydrolase/predicted nuclease with RNAse H fold/dephospho-CoA kinase
MNQKHATRNHDYWRLRDFEYAQPLYDLAFLLEIEALAHGGKKPKYRTFALWKAAISLDSYGANIDRWLDGGLDDDDLDQIPSNRIKTYLESIRDTGTVPEIARYLENDRYARCLRLRRLKGLGPTQIAQTLNSDHPSKEWLSQAARNCNLAENDVLNSLVGDSYGTWQPPHIVPPLLRLLRAIERECDSSPGWELHDITDAFRPITSECRITNDSASVGQLRRVCKSVLKDETMFEIGRGGRDILRLRHGMGWSVRMESAGEQRNTAPSASTLARKLDPLTTDLSGRLKSDLHLHTSWSDGAASLAGMANAAFQNGLSYLAVTDHSRSSKVQRGLTPVEWLRQSNSLMLAKPAIPVLHGIEVDILQDGTLDLPHSLLSSADFVIASVHGNWTKDAGLNTRRLIAAIETGRIDVLGHPTSALIGKPGVPDYFRAPADLNWDSVFDCCARWQVALEFNCFPSRFDLPPELLQKALDRGCWLVLGSDAHARAHLAHLKFGEEMVRRMNADKVLNFLPFDEMRLWIREARERRSHLGKTKRSGVQQTFQFEEVRPRKVLNAQLNPPQQIPPGSPIVGFDLTSGAKATGVAFLRQNHVETCSLLSDDDLIEFIQAKRPGIVSIDSPLGLPGGGDKIRPDWGIVRVAEQDLSSIGIAAYPALIDSMKELTLRGIRLRRRIEALGSPPIVIESYPGAAQDILCLPRKQRSLELLREGLRDLGLTGPGLLATSHDEIDAITSAIVGRFYESGDFEAMGTPEEAQLIVPTHRLFSFEHPPVICLAGKTGAGKSVVARYLAVFYGLQWCKTRDLIRELLVEDAAAPTDKKLFRRSMKPENITEHDLREFGAVILDEYQQAPLRQKLTDRIVRANAPIVVDAIRDPSDFDAARLKDWPMLVWFIDASDAAIHERLRERAKNTVRKDAIGSPVDRTANSIRSTSDLIVPNSGTLEELRWKVDDEFLSLLQIHT